MRTITLCFVLLLLAFSLLSCRNRFEEYEPYSMFDERMAAAENPNLPENNMYPGLEDIYASGYYNDRFENNSFDDNTMNDVPDRPVKTDAQKRASAKAAAMADTGEVAFDETRGAKHAANIGGM